MVEGFVGLPGSGKTYYLACLGLKAIKKGRKVYANFKLDGATYFKDLMDMIDVTEGVILVDEINLVCPSRWWDKFPPKLAYWWSQTRKSVLDVYWTSQHQDRVDKIVKEITNFIWQIRKFPFNFRVASCYLPEQIAKAKRENFGTVFFHLSSKVWVHFNTYERIEIGKNLSAFPSFPGRKNFWREPKIFKPWVVKKNDVHSARMAEADLELKRDKLKKEFPEFAKAVYGDDKGSKKDVPLPISITMEQVDTIKK